MIRLHLKTAAALAGFGLLCGCANPNASTCCQPQQGIFSRWFSGFGNRRPTECPCIETGNLTVGDGPIVPDPGCCGAPGYGVPTYGAPGVVPEGVPVSPPFVPPMAPPTALPLPGSNPLAQPVPANPSSIIKAAAK